MTLNEWEQSNIEVLTSREMGEWLGRRENRLLDEIRAEIEFEVDHRTYMLCAEDVFEIIDRYRGDKE